MDIMKISNATFWAWKKKGVIEVTKIGGSVRVLTNANELAERGRGYTPYAHVEKAGQATAAKKAAQREAKAAEKARILEGCDL
jgi:hypothetical protein